MILKITNSLTSKLETFTPHNKNNVKMYVCGPTVYDHPHIGNARSVVFYDTFFRVLKGIFGNSSVIFVRNITDVDDKIITRAKELNISVNTLTNQTINDFHDDMEYLNCLKPTFEPKATEHITTIISLIEILINSGAAYISNDHVYFNIKKSKDYGAIAGRKINELIAGSRIDIDKNKINPEDFVLWKPSSDGEEQSASYNSPWGVGRPGWHIECSAMSNFHLGADFDIHGGGVDLIFPHHTNEIAQSTCAFPGSKYAKYWVHNGFLTVKGEKMSKSLGNFLTVKNLRDQNVNGEVLRYLLLNSYYRAPVDYNEKSLVDSKHTLDYFYRAIEGLDYHNNELEMNNLPEEFLAHILNDLNFHNAFVYMQSLAKQIYKDDQQSSLLKKNLYDCGRFLGFFKYSKEDWFGKSVDIDIERLIKERSKAKIELDWSKADEIRNLLLQKGFVLEDLADGSTTWRKI